MFRDIFDGAGDLDGVGMIRNGFFVQDSLANGEISRVSGFDEDVGGKEFELRRGSEVAVEGLQVLMEGKHGRRFGYITWRGCCMGNLSLVNGSRMPAIRSTGR